MLQDRFEATSDAARRQRPSSDMGTAKLELQVHTEPQLAAARLPELYGVDSFELLVVDPEYAFIAWEITPQALESAERALGAETFGSRVLQLRLYAAAADREALAGFNLYGESGRWFLRTGTPGQAVTAVLGYAAGQQFHELLRRGPVEFPRNTPVETERYAELQVVYERGPQGQLILAGLGRPQSQRWPSALPGAALPPVALDYLDGQPGWAEAEPGTSARHAVRRRDLTSGLSSLTNAMERRPHDV
jgi:hypothetical protein